MTRENAPQNPVIPGSEIRGMIRSMYEAFTNSCMSALDFNKDLSSRVFEPFSAGILTFKNEKWKLYSADRYNIKIKDNKFEVQTDKSGQRYINDNNCKPVYSYQSVKFSFKNNSKGLKNVTSVSDKDTKQGYAVIGEPFVQKKKSELKKKSEFIFTQKEKLISDNNDMILNAINKFNVIIKDFYRDSKINKAKENTRSVTDFYKGREIPKNPKENTNIPVWYNKIKDESGNIYLYFSPACIGREIFINDFLKFTYSYEPCNGEELCPCCKLFGMVGDDSSNSSRLRFSDALFTGIKPEYSPITTLKELSAPKPTSMEMYTHIKDDNKGFWNYDIYYSDKNIILPAAEHIEINGRKMYYHNPNNNCYKYDGNDDDFKKNRKRLVSARPLKGKESNKFEFDIFFEHITENELKMLLVVTSLLFNQSDYCYKIGMGKPIGLGSIKISVNEVMLRTIEMTDNGISYKYIPTNNYKDYYDYDNISKEKAEETVRNFLKGENVVQSVFEQIKKMTYFYYAGKNNKNHYPQYPQSVEDDKEIFKWFSNNRTIGKKHAFEQVLGESGVLTKNGRKSSRNFRKY